MKPNATNHTLPAGSAAAGEPPDPHQLIRCLLSHTSPQNVEVCIDLWQRLAAGLVVIIGNEGFDALYDRSLHLAGEAYPWLNAEQSPAGAHARFACLRPALQGREPEEAAAAAVLLFTTFIRVLVTLIGRPLTTNILRTAWGDAYEAAAQEVSLWPKK